MNETRNNLGSAEKTYNGNVVGGQWARTAQGWDSRESGSPWGTHTKSDRQTGTNTLKPITQACVEGEVREGTVVQQTSFILWYSVAVNLRSRTL